MLEIRNAMVYGLHESIVASGYPMRTDLPADMKECCSRDFNRAIKLSGSPIGEGHDNFLNGIVVQFDLTAPIKVWTEAQRYHFLDFVSSSSTMHCLSKMNLTDSKAFDEYVTNDAKLRLITLQEEYNKLVEEKAEPKRIKKAYLQLLMNCPVGLNLTARMTTNYRQLKTIYKQRRNHRLPHWKAFCEWIEGLPQSELITGGIK